ncbi:MAG: UDP-N-acetylmuramate:L-alanyl-gamma-D-glutamyl-meso-diaminopimelate ligase [Gammaproteobacteria bacterium]|nr:UDP-N-acetylmuramate:L-alanyl-gamma-D-glutamyl-meso-diaminopimelate ligase [Gammaproteobacteria bacterium]
MHIHILGICGTFMGGIAAIAKELGHKVTGSDLNVYPPMSTQLEALGIQLTQGWDESQFDSEPDITIIGNALSRGNPAVEYVLARKLPYTSGPEWLKQHLLKDRWVLAVSGTHGKTTTSSMLAWILADAGFDPGYLIGGVPGNFTVSATAGSNPFFVIEADEYDTAFFDKRSKFVHYLPNTLVMNNLEFDHADIFSDIEAIKTQFHHVIRIVPNNGLILTNADDPNLTETLEKGCWTPVQNVHCTSDFESIATSTGWHAKLNNNSLGLKDGANFDVVFAGKPQGNINWTLTGRHNVNNALMAIGAARHAGIDIESAISSLNRFKTPKRRMELLSTKHEIHIYDDFAHHPTAIETTLAGLRNNVGKQRIIAVIEPRSNTMKMGIHKDTLVDSWQLANMVFIHQNDVDWQIPNNTATVYNSVDKIVEQVVEVCQPNDHIVVMSNGSFAGIHQRLIDAIDHKFTS